MEAIARRSPLRTTCLAARRTSHALGVDADWSDEANAGFVKGRRREHAGTIPRPSLPERLSTGLFACPGSPVANGRQQVLATAHCRWTIPTIRGHGAAKALAAA